MAKTSAYLATAIGLNSEKMNPLSSLECYKLTIDKKHPMMNILIVVGLILAVKEEKGLEKSRGGINS